MAFTAQDVKELREKTGVGMMECKKALTEADGDMDRAFEILRERGLAASEKKASRIAAEGAVIAYTDEDSKVTVLLEINSETDFVGKNEKFQEFGLNVAKTIAANKPASVEALAELPLVGTDRTVTEGLNDLILVIGENIKIRRFVRYEGPCVAYIHAGGTHGVLVNFEVSDEVFAKAEFEAYGKDIAMQIAAANPSYLNKEEVPAEVIESERAIARQQAINEGKPANIVEKMIDGCGRVLLRQSGTEPVIRIMEENENKKVLLFNEENELLMPILMIVPLQYLAYKVRVMKNINPDQPRNLAKSVTVE